MSDILASGKTGVQRYQDNNAEKPVPDLDIITLTQNFQSALEETRGFSYSNEKGSTESDAPNLSIIDEANIGDYSKSLPQLVQTYVANASYLDLDAASTANNLILVPRKIGNINSPNGTNYSKNTSLPFTFRDNLNFAFRAVASNTNAVQVSIPDLLGLSGTISLVDEDGAALVGGEIVANKFYQLVTTGTSGTKKAILKKGSGYTTGTNLTLSGKFALAPNTGATIAAGVIEITSSTVIVYPEAAASIDDLDTVNGTIEGQIVILRNSDNGTKVIRVKHLTGNIHLINPQLAYIDLAYSSDVLTFESRNGILYQIGGGTREDFAASLAMPGYQKLPSGFIEQWGISSVQAATSGAVTLTFQFAFTTCIGVIANEMLLGEALEIGASKTNSQITIQWQNATAGNKQFFYRAIGKL